MAKSDVLSALQADLENPGALKSGEFLQEHVLRTARRALAAGDHDGLVAALRDWLSLRQEPQTMLAVNVAKEERLRELAPDVQALRTDVQAGRFFPSFYLASGGVKLIHCGGEKLIRPYVQWSPVYFFRTLSGRAVDGASVG